MLENLAFFCAVGGIIWVAYLSIKLDDSNLNRKKKWQPGDSNHQVSPPTVSQDGAAD